MQTLLNFMRSLLSTSWNYFLSNMSWSIFSLTVGVSGLSLISLIHLELIFVQGARYWQFHFFTGYPVWAAQSEEAVFSTKYIFGIFFRNPVCVVVCVSVWSTLFHPCTCFCTSIMLYSYRYVVKLEIRYGDTPEGFFVVVVVYWFFFLAQDFFGSLWHKILIIEIYDRTE